MGWTNHHVIFKPGTWGKFWFWVLVCLFLTSFLDGIVSHLKKQAGPASVELKSVAEFEKFIAERDASVVGEHIFLVIFAQSSDCLYMCTVMDKVYSGGWREMVLKRCHVFRILCRCWKCRTEWVPEVSQCSEGIVPLCSHKPGRTSEGAQRRGGVRRPCFSGCSLISLLLLVKFLYNHRACYSSGI